MRWATLLAGITVACIVGPVFISATPEKVEAKTTIFWAKNEGVIGDGREEAAAVGEMMKKALSTPGAVKVVFEPGKTYRLTGGEGYAFRIDGAKNLTIDGSGSRFIFGLKTRWLRVTNSSDVEVRGFTVDYDPAPFSTGTVIAKNKDAGWLYVEIDEGATIPPEVADGEMHKINPDKEGYRQPNFFALLWFPGEFSTARDPYFASESYEVSSSGPDKQGRPRTVKLQMSDGAKKGAAGTFDRVVEKKTRISVPIAGVAFRYGPGATCELVSNAGSISMSDIEVRSAPMFAFNVADNEGAVSFRNVNIQPEPGSPIRSAACRDGFHVKSNSGPLRWEACTVKGLGDDAFNLSCLFLETLKGKGDGKTRFTLKQKYQLGTPRVRENDVLAAYDRTAGVLLGEATVRLVKIGKVVDGKTPEIDVELTRPFAGLNPANELLLWNVTTANPDAMIRDCRIDGGSRFRSPVRVENSRFNGIIWSTGFEVVNGDDSLEGPMPHDITIRNSTLKLGSGNRDRCVEIAGPHAGHSTQVIRNIRLEDNRIYGGVCIKDVSNLVVAGNTFEDGRPVAFKNVRDVQLSGNSSAKYMALDPKHVERGGRLVRFKGDDVKVYFSLDGRYHYIPNDALMNRVWPEERRAKKFNNKMGAPPLVEHPGQDRIGSPLARDTELVKSSDKDGVYLIQDGKKRPILRPEFVDAFGPWSLRPQAEIDAYHIGDDIADFY